jgi:hypothetical protein
MSPSLLILGILLKFKETMLIINLIIKLVQMVFVHLKCSQINIMEKNLRFSHLELSYLYYLLAIFLSLQQNIPIKHTGS